MWELPLFFVGGSLGWPVGSGLVVGSSGWPAGPGLSLLFVVLRLAPVTIRFLWAILPFGFSARCLTSRRDGKPTNSVPDRFSGITPST